MFRQELRFDDIDQYATMVDHADLRHMQLGKGSIQGLVELVATPNLVLGRHSINGHVRQTGATMKGYFTFFIPNRNCPPFYWNGIIICETRWAVLNGSEFEGVLPAAFRGLPVMIEGKFLKERANVLGYEDAMKHIWSGMAVDIAPAKAKHVHDLGNMVLDQPHSVILHDDQLCDAILSAFTSRNSKKDEISQNALKEVVDWIENSSEITSVSKVCSQFKTPERTLRYAFQKRYGMGPKAFIQRVALNKVRSELKDPSNLQVSIHQLAGRTGYWHMGQFAQDYRKLFGELPSETKKRSLA